MSYKASYQQPATSCWVYKSATLEIKPPTLVKPSDDCSSGGHPDCSLVRNPEPNPKATPKHLNLRNWEIINVCGLKLPNLGVICYTEINTIIQGNFRFLFCLSYL